MLHSFIDRLFVSCRNEMQRSLQVLNLEGWRRAAELVKEANESLNTVQKESKKTDFFKLTKSSYLFVEGEIYYRAGNWPKALKLLNRSLKLMEDPLKSHTSTYFQMFECNRELPQQTRQTGGSDQVLYKGV